MAETAIVPHADPAPLIQLATDSVSSPATRRAYARALSQFFIWYGATAPGAFSRAVVLSYKAYQQEIGVSGSSINQGLSAIRKLAQEAADNGFLDQGLAAGIARIDGVRRLGQRTGNWLTRKQAVQLLKAPKVETLKGKRDRVILGLLLGCGLRRQEAVDLQVEQVQEREDRAILADVRGKGGRIRTVPMPPWVSKDIGEWLLAGAVTTGRLLRAVDRCDRLERSSMSASGIWWVVKGYAQTLGLGNLAPHDLRRTFSHLAEKGGAELRQIQAALGHSSIQTTEKYLGSGLDLADPACDHLGVKP